MHGLNCTKSQCQCRESHTHKEEAMKSTIFTNARIVLENGIMEDGYIGIQEDKIKEIGRMQSCPTLKDFHQVINCENKGWLLPGMIDIHIHGIGGSDVMDASIESLDKMTHLLPQEGTTAFLATTMTNPIDKIEKAIENVTEYMENHCHKGQAEVLGIHLEGPFIHPKQKGAQPEKDIIPPNIELFKKWQNLAHQHIRLVTLAPELDPKHTLIRYLKETGVIASMGHTDATYNEVKKAVGAGLSQATHLFNGMRGLHHREPGAAGAALLLDEMTIEIIADGIHVNPALMKLIYRLKGPENMVLITDSIRAKCLKNGTYDLGGQEVEVTDGRAWLTAQNSLAGSVLKLHEGRRNMEEWLDLGIQELMRMTSSTPAKKLGIYDRKGSLTVGKDADLILLNEKGDVQLTVCRGEMAWSSSHKFLKPV